LAGETRDPGRYMPIALISSVLISMLVYVGLQVSFITALQPGELSGGWAHLRFSGMFGPLAAIAMAAGAFWWAVLLYVDALISPLGTAFIYVTSSPRSHHGRRRDGHRAETGREAEPAGCSLGWSHRHLLRRRAVLLSVPRRGRSWSRPSRSSPYCHSA
ncbi:amino acid permease family protein, partial [mine drainage metagenome]